MDLTTRKQNLDRDITHINDCIIAQSPISISSIMDACEEYFAIREEERKVFEQAEKYRWHDLRKDPNDLPKCESTKWYEREEVIVAFANGKYGYCYLEKLSNSELIWWEGDFSAEFNEVIAWKYIEPLEVEDD